MKVDPRFTQETGREVYTGNELLVKGALETPGGVHLLTGYPGSPVAGFFDTCQAIAPLLNEQGVVARMASNEAISVAMVNGAQMTACRSVVAFKSVGLHVAADALALGVMAGTKGDGGTVVICGDDPWSDSTQVPADSRFLAEHLRLPMVEPSNAQEVKDWIALSFELGKAGQIYIGYMMPTALADGGGSVDVKPNQFPVLNTNQRQTLSYEKDIEPHLDQFVLLPPRSWDRECSIVARHEAVCAEARRLGINKIINKPQKGERAPMGFVASGLALAYLTHALEEMGLSNRLPILKLGISYPVDSVLLHEFAEVCDQLIVIEERRGFVEKQVRQALSAAMQQGEIQTEIWGKQFPRDLQGIPETRGLHPSLLIERLVPLFKEHPRLPMELTNGSLAKQLNLIAQTSQVEINLPIRTATFCPGCPHRDSASVLLELRKDLLDSEYMQRHHKQGPMDLICHGDTGCYTMLMFEPTKPLMHNYSGMGLGGGTGGGIDPFITNKQLVFMGDGTFYHSGQTTISNSIASGQDITYIILDNATTAMTGHQPNSGTEFDISGNPIVPQDIERIVKGMVPKKLKNDITVVRIDPADRPGYRRMLESTLLADGVKVVIADKECGITFHRRKRREENKVREEQGYLTKETRMNIAEDACEFCLECTNLTGCPGLKIVASNYGKKMQTDMSWCVNDGACVRINACPAFEEITITRKQPARSGDEYINLTDIPEAPRPIHADQAVWRCLLSGVGGMGIGLATSILVSAGHKMGYQVQFFDKKGLAIRNGGVISQIVFSHDDKKDYTTPTIPFGKADLLIGIDLLEAARAVDPRHPRRVASPDRTAMILNTAKTPTILTLLGRDDFDPDDLTVTLKSQSQQGQFFAFNVGDLCERVLDSKLYVNIMMLGMAYQLGYLPLTLETIEQSIRKLVKKELDRNIRAFHIGRKIVVRPDLFIVEARHDFETARQALRRKKNMVKQRYAGKRGEIMSRRYKLLMRSTFRATRGRIVSDQIMRDVVIRVYDCLVWGGMDYAERYCKRVVEVFRQDDGRYGKGIIDAVVWNLAKVMLIKDEIYTASLLTSPEKYRYDRMRYKVNPARGDKIVYKHFNRPEFVLFGRKIRFEWKSTDWQLRLASQCTWLRKLMPKWHKREKDFRNWYEELIDHLSWTNESEYRTWLQVMKLPEQVTGYREVRYPKMDEAMAKAEALLSGTDDADQSTGQIKVSLTNRILDEQRVM